MASSAARSRGRPGGSVAGPTSRLSRPPPAALSGRAAPIASTAASSTHEPGPASRPAVPPILRRHVWNRGLELVVGLDGEGDQRPRQKRRQRRTAHRPRLCAGGDGDHGDGVNATRNRPHVHRPADRTRRFCDRGRQTVILVVVFGRPNHHVCPTLRLRLRRSDTQEAKQRSHERASQHDGK